MNLNKHIIIATLGLVAIGAVKHALNPSVKLTPIVIGGYVVMLVLSVIDLFGPQASKMASAFAMITLLSGALTELDASTINTLAKAGTAAATQQTKGPGPTGPAGPPGTTTP